jgi:hypothetical protein
LFRKLYNTKNVDNSEEKNRGMNEENQGIWKKRGVIRQILKDHFHDFMEMHVICPKFYTSLLREGECGIRDMGYAR